MKFDGKIALALTFSPSNRIIMDFECYGVKEVPDEPQEDNTEMNMEKCPDNEAEAWGVYAILNDNGTNIHEWICDCDNKEAAERLTSVFQSIRIETLRELSRTGEFIHPEIESGLHTLDSNQPYNYTIEKTSPAPDNWELHLFEADCEQTYNYESKEDAENDVRMASKHFQLELINFSDSNSLPA